MCLGFGGKRGVRGAECGVWKMRRVENEECGKCRDMKLTNNLIPL